VGIAHHCPLADDGEIPQFFSGVPKLGNHVFVFYPGYFLSINRYLTCPIGAAICQKLAAHGVHVVVNPAVPMLPIIWWNRFRPMAARRSQCNITLCDPASGWRLGRIDVSGYTHHIARAVDYHPPMQIGRKPDITLRCDRVDLAQTTHLALSGFAHCCQDNRR